MLVSPNANRKCRKKSMLHGPQKRVLPIDRHLVISAKKCSRVISTREGKRGEEAFSKKRKVIMQSFSERGVTSNCGARIH